MAGEDQSEKSGSTRSTVFPLIKHVSVSLSGQPINQSHTMKAGRAGGNGGKKVILDAPKETTRLLLDSVRTAHETERIGAQ